MKNFPVKLISILSFLLIQNMIFSKFGFSHPFDFFEESRVPFRSVGSVLRQDMKIPVGVIGSTVHSLFLLKGTATREIKDKILGARESLGLQREIPSSDKAMLLQSHL